MNNMYENYSDERLMDIAAKVESLTDAAKEQLKIELEKRNIGTEEINERITEMEMIYARKHQEVESMLRDKFRLRTIMVMSLSILAFIFGLVSVIFGDDLKFSIALIIGAPIFYVVYLYFTIIQKDILIKLLTAGYK